MLTRSFWTGFRNRTVAALLLLGVVSLMDTEPVEWAWAKLVSMSNDNITYTWTMRTGGMEHLIRTDLPDNVSMNLAPDGRRIPYLVVPLASQCTYVSLAALVIPFAVTRLTLGGVILPPLAAVAIVAIVNFLRLQLMMTLPRAGISWRWAHDVPHYTAYTLTIAGAVWYYYRSTVLCGDGNHADGAADGSPQTVNA